MMRYTVVLIPEPDGSAVNVEVPAMPGVHTWGRTEAEALDSAREAIALHLEGYAERGRPAPRDRRPRIGRAMANRVRRRANSPRIAMVEVDQTGGVAPITERSHQITTRISR
jgi:predicted RNase H-like HicB family nuclease